MITSKNPEFDFKLKAAKAMGVPNLNSCPYGNIPELEKRISNYLALIAIEDKEKKEKEYKDMQQRWNEIICEKGKTEIEFSFRLNDAISIGVPDLSSCPNGDLYELERRVLSYLKSLEEKEKKEKELKYEMMKQQRKAEKEKEMKNWDLNLEEKQDTIFQTLS